MGDLSGDLIRPADTPTDATEVPDVRTQMAELARQAAERIRERDRQLAIRRSPQREEWPN